MKHFSISFFFSCLLICHSLLAFSQIDKIKDLSDAAKEIAPATREIAPSNSDGCSNACGDAIASGCFDFFINTLLIGGFELHEKYLDEKDENPEVVSLELMPQFAFNPSGNYLFLPRIRGNWGLLGTDFRFMSLLEAPTIDGVKFFNTIDWQILQLNFYLNKNFVLRTGVGFMHESYNYSTYNENTLGLSFLSNDRKIGANGEFRIAIDYDAYPSARLEGNVHLNYRIFESNHFIGYITTGLLLQRYYDEVNIWGIHSGFNFRMH